MCHRSNRRDTVSLFWPCSQRRVLRRNTGLLILCRLCRIESRRRVIGSIRIVDGSFKRRSQMARSNAKRGHSDLPYFESVNRLSSLPIVESSLDIVGHVYRRIKSSNSLMSWSLDAAEQSLALAAASAKPAIFTLNGPITTIDQLLCKGIDIVEQRVPAVHVPPQQMYWSTRDYVEKKIVRPVLMRAGSVKEIGSQAASVAVDTLDGALTVADRYVDLYLPGDPTDKAIDETVTNETVSKTTRTIKHGARFSRKLQKRLTRRTLAEARALKEQGTQCVHVFLYVIELLATNPKLALRKARELWATLSLPEPENQARPATLEQLLVLLTRESARRIVHLVNGTASLAARTPRRIGKLLIRISRRFLALTDATLKAASIIGQGETTKTTQMSMAIRSAVRKLGTNTSRLLEQLATLLASPPCMHDATTTTTVTKATMTSTGTGTDQTETGKITTTTTATTSTTTTTTSKTSRMQDLQRNHNNHTSMTSVTPINGIE